MRASERDESLTHPSEHSGLVSSCDLIMPMTISSDTRPPWSMIFLASLPRSVPRLTSSRSMSPVARWHTLYASLILGAWVPLPARRERRERGGRRGQLRPARSGLLEGRHGRGTGCASASAPSECSGPRS